MRKVFVLIGLIVLQHLSFAQYTTPNTGKIWNLDSLVQYAPWAINKISGSYVVLQDITIAGNDEIRVLTNEYILFSSQKQITVQGTLKINPPSYVIVSAVDSTNAFKGFRFENSDNSILRKMLYQFGSGIKLVGSDILIDSCIFRKNVYNVNFASGTIDAFQSNPTIQHCKIFHNARAAITSAANATSSPYIHHNEIFENCTSNSNIPQINLGSAGSDSIIIRKNIVIGLYTNSGGIALSTLAGGSINCRIDSNYVSNNRYGIALLGNNIKSIIKYNIIENNNIDANPLTGGSGINVNGDNTNNATIKHNIIRNNYWGITIQGTALPNLGQISGNDTINIGKNTIMDNANSGNVYDVYNNTPNYIYAHNNYWGTNDPAVIESHIFHQPDQASLGIVDFGNYIVLERQNYVLINENQFVKNAYYNRNENTINIEMVHNNALPVQYTLYSVDGSIVMKGEMQQAYAKIAISSQLPDGLYLLKIVQNEKQRTFKLFLH